MIPYRVALNLKGQTHLFHDDEEKPMAPQRVELGEGRIAIIDEADADKIAGMQFTAQRLEGEWDAVADDGTILDRFLTDCPPDQFVIHRNGDGLDCRRANMLLATAEQRGWWDPAAQDGPSQYKGVAPIPNGNGKPWSATILRKGKALKIGAFETEELAARAYDEAARRQYGPYARLNFPAPDGSEGPSACAN